MRCNVASQIVDAWRPFIGWTWECVLTLPLVFPRGFILGCFKSFPLFFFFFDELFSSKFSSSRISFSGKTHLPSLLIYVFLLVNYSEVRLAFPSFCFFFARLGVFFKSSIQWQRHSKCKVFPKTPWFEKKKFIYNNLKFFIYLLFKKNRNTLKSYLEHS